MPSPNRAELLRRAKEAFRDHGRGFVVVVEGRDMPHHGLLDKLRTALADEAKTDGIVKAAAEALDSYDPETEAAVIDERTEGVFVLIVGAKETRVIGEFFLTKPT